MPPPASKGKLVENPRTGLLVWTGPVGENLADLVLTQRHAALDLLKLELPDRPAITPEIEQDVERRVKASRKSNP